MCSATPVHLLFLAAYLLILLRALVIFFVSDSLELDENVPVVYLFKFTVLGVWWTLSIWIFISLNSGKIYYFLYKSYVMFSYPSFILSLSAVLCVCLPTFFLFSISGTFPWLYNFQTSIEYLISTVKILILETCFLFSCFISNKIQCLLLDAL